jgi:hypothetical protein
MKWPWTKRPEQPWPALPRSGFIKDKAATEADVSAGDAVFYQQTDDRAQAQSCTTQIPQYAYWRDEAGSDIPAVLVQAEHHIDDVKGQPLLGLRLFDGSALVATAGEVKLLGAKPPLR